MTADAPEQATPSPVRRAVRFIGTAVSLLSLGFFVWTSRHHTEAFKGLSLDAHAIGGLAAGVLAHLLLIVVDGFGWSYLLRSVGERQSVRDSLGVFCVSQFAKYVPGNVAQHIGRVLLARERGMDSSRVTMTLVLETAWGTGIGALVGALALLVGQARNLNGGYHVPLWQVLLVAAIAFVGPVVLLNSVGKWAPSSLKKRLGLDALVLPGAARFAVYCLFLVASYVCLGLGVDVLARGLLMAESHFVLVTGIVTVAWLLGYFVPGAPAGLGVREVMLLGLLTRVYGEAAAVQLTVCLRLASTAADVLAFGGGLVLLRSGARSAGSGG